MTDVVNSCHFCFLMHYAKLLPLALIHMLGNVFTNMSLGKVAVSFTHTIKAMEPFFSVLLSVLFLGEVLRLHLRRSFRLKSGLLHITFVSIFYCFYRHLLYWCWVLSSLLLVELYWHPWLKFLSTGKWCLQSVKEFTASNMVHYSNILRKQDWILERHGFKSYQSIAECYKQESSRW